MSKTGRKPDSISEDIVSRLKTLLGRASTADDYVRFRIDLAIAQAAVHRALKGAAIAPPQAQMKESHTPALDPASIPLDQKELTAYFEKICTAAEQRGGHSEHLATLRREAEREPLLLADLVRRVTLQRDEAYQETLVERTGMPAEALLFIGSALSSPFVAEAARRYAEKSNQEEDQTSGSRSCPICGGMPALAKLRRDDGKRILFCSLCGSDWAFPRMECPFCGNSEQAKLGVLLIDHRGPSRIETCEKCKHYIKSFDERQYPEGEVVMPFVEETATLYLDILAEREGYVRNLPCMALR